MKPMCAMYAFVHSLKRTLGFQESMRSGIDRPRHYVLISVTDLRGSSCRTRP
jgi:hypothetical protein